jgi:Nickel responsive protein SCO4226-like
VPTYLVERYLPGMEPVAFAEAVHRTASAAAELTGQGVPVRHLASVYVAADECSFCCFEAVEEEAVREASRRASMPFWRVVQAVLVEP